MSPSYGKDCCFQVTVRDKSYIFQTLGLGEGAIQMFYGLPGNAEDEARKSQHKQTSGKQGLERTELAGAGSSQGASPCSLARSHASSVTPTACKLNEPQF